MHPKNTSNAASTMKPKAGSCRVNESQRVVNMSPPKVGSRSHEVQRIMSLTPPRSLRTSQAGDDPVSDWFFSSPDKTEVDQPESSDGRNTQLAILEETVAELQKQFSRAQTEAFQHRSRIQELETRCLNLERFELEASQHRVTLQELETRCQNLEKFEILNISWKIDDFEQKWNARKSCRCKHISTAGHDVTLELEFFGTGLDSELRISISLVGTSAPHTQKIVSVSVGGSTVTFKASKSDRITDIWKLPDEATIRQDQKMYWPQFMKVADAKKDLLSSGSICILIKLCVQRQMLVIHAETSLDTPVRTPRHVS
eukprot:TRINITY_DN35931_c0_g1_i2.p1 TRINITY_DN35931_c0_g1~~TRINITY_DN35931_c0_g1_i2.p1  ORF type:complete len:314 (-),score=39.13 TRINITY_DN35931_c0_g1_i2:120-1061(-)